MQGKAHFKNEWKMNPESAVPGIVLVDSLFKQEKVNEAKTALLETFNAEGALDEVYLNLGLVTRAMWDYNSARAYLLKVLEITPDYQESKRGLADTECWLNYVNHVDGPDESRGE